MKAMRNFGWLLSLGVTIPVTESFVSPTLSQRTSTHHTVVQMTSRSINDSSGENQVDKQGRDGGDAASLKRREFLHHSPIMAGLVATSVGLSYSPDEVQAKVEGYAPPKKALSEEYRQGTSALADMDENAPLPKEAYVKLPSGVTYADLRVGNGNDIVQDGSKVNLQWVLRKSNGYFVDSSEVQGSVPFIFTIGKAGSAIQGVDEGVRGMRSGGTRRLLIPPRLGYVEGLEDGKPGPLPAGFGPRQQMRRVQNVRADVPGEYIFLEVQVTRVR